MREHRGGVSKGCERCRARKIKCNEARPRCERCTKTGHVCEYRDMMAIMFRDETTAVEKKAQQKWRARAKPKNLTDDFYNYLISMKTPGFAMPTDLVDCARNRFFFDYPLPSDDPENPQKGVLDYLPGLYAQACSGSPLPAAVNAVCLVNFYRRAGPSSNKALLLAGKAYGEALAGVKRATENQTQASSDSVVMAVHLLGIYESMSTTMVGGRNPSFWNAHNYGLAALIKLRPIPKPQDGVRYRLFHTVNMAMLSACLTYGRESYLSRERLSDFYAEDRSIVKLAGLIHQGVDLLAQYKECTEEPLNVDLFKAQSLLFQLYELDMALAKWAITNQMDAYYLNKFEYPLLGQPRWMQTLMLYPGAPNINNRYDCVQTAYGWNTYRMLRILVNCTMLASKSIHSSLGLSNMSEAVDVIKILVDEICSSVLSSFVVPIPGKSAAENEWDICGIRGFFLTGPLTIASETLRTVVIGAEAEEKADWIDNIRAFIARWIHNPGTYCVPAQQVPGSEGSIPPI